MCAYRLIAKNNFEFARPAVLIFRQEIIRYHFGLKMREIRFQGRDILCGSSISNLQFPFTITFLILKFCFHMFKAIFDAVVHGRLKINF